MEIMLNWTKSLNAQGLRGCIQDILTDASSAVNPVVVLFAFYLATSLPVEIAFAQSVSGVMSGTVVDQQHRSVTGVTVRVVDQLNATDQTTQTDEDGYFVFAQLRPGKYTLSIEQNGFEKLEKRDILVLTADRLSAAALILKVGSGTEVVKVTSETPAVQTTSSEQSAVISANEMVSLPVLGNDYVSLTKIIPGSTYLGNGSTTLGGVSSQASFMAIPPASASYFSTNGVLSSFSNYSWDDSPTAVANIQDVKILVSGFEPERGKALGAVLDVTTKSGSRDLHGSLWYAFRNEALNANDYFNNLNGLPKSRYRFNTVTGTLGGPLFIPSVYDRQQSNLFFFFSYDNEPSTMPQGLNEFKMPTALERTGDVQRRNLGFEKLQLAKQAAQKKPVMFTNAPF